MISMNSGVLDLKTRRKVSLAPVAGEEEADSAKLAACRAGSAAPAGSADAKNKKRRSHDHHEFH